MSQREILQLFFSFIWDKKRKVRFRFLLALLITSIVIATDLLTPIVLKWVVNLLSNPASENFLNLILILISYGIIWLTSRLLGGLREILSAKILERAVKNLSLRVFTHIHSLSPRFHYEQSKGGLVNDALWRVQNSLPVLFWDLGFFILPNFIQAIGALFIVGILYGPLFSFILGTTLSVFVCFILFANKKSLSFYREAQKTQQQTTNYVADSFLNFETIKYYNKEEYEKLRCKEVLVKRQKARLKKIWHTETVRLIQGLILGLGLIIMTLASGYATAHGKLTPGDFVLINGYLFQLIVPLDYIGSLLRQIREALTDLEHIGNILKTESEIKDVSGAKILQISAGEIVFDHVEFNYGERQIFKDLSFIVPAGKTIAIVGPTGSGKSTISRLLLRFYDIQKGSILIDHQDISKVTQTSLHEAIGIVPQETLLFDESLYYNILYAKPEANKEEVEKVIYLAQLEEFVRKLPEGLQTIVGQRGVKLSGGEKQRIAIARILLKNPRIFIFDEATSALDTQTEKEIQANLRQISKDHTTIIIAHRLSTIVDADKIIVLKEGELLEEGTHLELLKKEGLYSMLWNKQIMSNQESVL